MAKRDMRLGHGGRFKKLEHSIESREGISADRAKDIAAAIGRKKYGNKRMNRMAAAGRKRHSHRGSSR